MSVIETRELTHIYLAGTPYEKKALNQVSLSINKGELFGIIGANGSGKSTLIQHFNGLLTPSYGTVRVYGEDTSNRSYRNELWKKVGLMFQFPEQQLFASTVFDELAFGLKNMGLEGRAIENRVEEALLQVGLNPKEVIKVPPLGLSGGARRQVALACILAMRPTILVLDEPTAGVDPSASEYILKAIKKIQREQQVTVVMVSHYVNDLIFLADKLAFLKEGRLLSYGDKKTVFRDMAQWDMNNLILPEHLKLMHRLAAYGLPVNTEILTLEEAATEISRVMGEWARCER